mmetsp:Transcript_2668/g.3565  ORF Transcript_2668/g.3565 Transcript_2668/m.3565 type:complete len:110 (+) Transcript_2668:651-980(+)
MLTRQPYSSLALLHKKFYKLLHKKVYKDSMKMKRKHIKQLTRLRLGCLQIPLELSQDQSYTMGISRGCSSKTEYILHGRYGDKAAVLEFPNLHIPTSKLSMCDPSRLLW